MKDQAKKVIGGVASRLMPKTASNLANGYKVPHSMLDKLMVNSMIQEAAEEGDFRVLRNQLKSFWQGVEGDFFYDAYPERFKEWFLGDHQAVFTRLKKVIEQSEGKFQHIVEIGCGDGKVLSYLTSMLPSIHSFTGLDINEGVIERNKASYNISRLKFHCGDAAEWMEEYIRPGTIVMCYGGVLEYFLESEVRKLYATLCHESPVGVLLVEPLDRSYDLAVETASRPAGLENSFSHHHERMLTDAGFDIDHFEEIENEFRWTSVLAFNPALEGFGSGTIGDKAKLHI
ncbi:MAG: class I SAM-dependent methyltransferase [Verrucomicrobiota bacterium]